MEMSLEQAKRWRELIETMIRFNMDVHITKSQNVKDVELIEKLWEEICDQL